MNYSLEIVNVVREKSKKRKIWQKTQAAFEKTKFNQFKRKQNKAINQIKQESMNNFLELNNDKHIDILTVEATKSSNRPTIQVPPLTYSQDKWVKDNKGTVYSFANYLIPNAGGNDNLVLDGTSLEEQHIKSSQLQWKK